MVAGGRRWRRASGDGAGPLRPGEAPGAESSLRFRSRDAASTRLHVNDEIHQLLDGRGIFLQAHGFGNRQAKTKGE
ncbi:MAG: hypothetical protein ACE5EG_03980, partial [Thermoanaerobaculia bacterium]